MDTRGTVAVVTGASRGLGRTIATALAERGLVVAAVARNSTRFTADISRPGDVFRLKEEVEAELGTPTVLVNAAGVFGPVSLVKDSDPYEWIQTVMVDAIGPYLTCRAFLGGMLEAGWGRIVNVSSAASLHPPRPFNSAYGTSKTALNHFTRHLAAELEGTGVTANVIHPGDVRTDMWADIRDQAARLGDAAAGYSDWVAWVDETGGDPPEKAAKLVLDIVESEVDGRFLWIDDPLQAPPTSWGDAEAALPWQS